MPFGRACLGEWPLDPAVTYLNHGTVGVTPLRVLRAQREIRERVERAPAQQLLREQSGLIGRRHRRPAGALRDAAAAVAAFVGARGEDLVFVDNVTSGVNAVLWSQTFQPGDEVVVTDHGYGAVINAIRFICERSGAVVRRVSLPYPDFSPDGVLDAILAGLTSSTRLVVVDHITAESGLVLPVAAIAAGCRARGIRVLVDGAHVPGVLPLDVPSLGVDYYAANLHKWACVPRSAGFLWAAPEVQANLHPPVISWGFGQGFVAEFDWVGTRDLSPYLAAHEALSYLADRGPDAAWRWNHELAWEGATALADAWGTTIPAQKGDVGFMVTVPLPVAFGSSPDDAARIRDALLFDHAIEVQVHAGWERVWVRVCAQVYNERTDFDRLEAAVATLA
jgi:isopenicillin-N epimerase